MPPAASSALGLVAGMGRKDGRQAAAVALASQVGVEEVLLFTRDPVLGALVPAPGMPQTLRGGRSWREYLAACPESGRFRGNVELPKGAQRPVLALIANGTAVILIGGTPSEIEVLVLEGLLPLISATLAAEQEATLARSAAAAAADAAGRAQALATALEHARADASALNAELRQEHRRKDEFLAMLGHELRNPLAPLVTSIEMLRVQGLGRPVPEGLVGIMARQTAQLSRLVDDLLDVARVSQGKIELQRAPLRLADAVTGALEQSDALVSARRHRVEVLGADLKLYVLGDHARLVQVFGNLLNNSAKYTDPGGKITVTLAAQGASAIVRVTDTGIGITAEMQPRVFDAFTQAPVALARAQGGLGIGLTLVRTLVQLHDGRISVESPGIGHGSTFSVVLPLVEAPNAGVWTSRQPGKPPAKRALRILIVDDNNDAADSLAELLRVMGHHVEVAYTAASALKLYGDTDSDLALLDIGLPDLDGYELARRLRHMAKPGARLVALTGYGVDEAKKSLRGSSFDVHIVKPITNEVLENLLAETSRAGSCIGRGLA